MFQPIQNYQQMQLPTNGSQAINSSANTLQASYSPISAMQQGQPQLCDPSLQQQSCCAMLVQMIPQMIKNIFNGVIRLVNNLVGALTGKPAQAANQSPQLLNNQTAPVAADPSAVQDVNSQNIAAPTASTQEAAQPESTLGTDIDGFFGSISKVWQKGRSIWNRVTDFFGSMFDGGITKTISKIPVVGSWIGKGISKIGGWLGF